MIWTRQAITNLKEDDLSREVLVPLFEAMGYHDVRFFGGGALEQGKDIVMWRDEPVRGRINVAVVVKARPISGKLITGEVVTQLRQAFGKEYLDSSTAKPMKIHECFVVTSKAISKEGTNCLEGLIKNEQFSHYVEYLDGTRLWESVEKYLGERALLPRLAETYRRLQSVAPNVGVEMDGDTLTLKLANELHFEPVIDMATFSNTPEGEASRENYQRFVRTGEPAELPLAALEGIPIPDLVHALGIDWKAGILRIASAGRPLSGALTLRSANGQSVTFGHVSFVVKAGTEQIHLTNAAQGLPVIFDWTIRMREDRVPVANINYSFSLVGWSSHWLDAQQRALAVMARGCSIIFEDERTGIEHVLASAGSGLVKHYSNERFRELVRELAWVENQVKEPILVPARPFFTQEDLRNLSIIKNVIKSGRIGLESAKFTIVPVPQHRNFLMNALEHGIIGGFPTSESTSWPLLDSAVVLGPAEIHGVGARLFPVSPLNEALEAIERGDDVEVEVRPGKGKRLYMKYLWWHGRRTR